MYVIVGVVPIMVDVMGVSFFKYIVDMFLP